MVIKQQPLDIRWHQRFQNFKDALGQLEDAVSLGNKRALSQLEQQGLIQAFEFTHELAWNTLKDFFENQGNVSIMGSRDAIREAFKKGLIENGEVWMDMIKSRNLSSHVYHKDIADQIAQQISGRYLDLFKALKNRLGQQLKYEQDS